MQCSRRRKSYPGSRLGIERRTPAEPEQRIEEEDRSMSRAFVNEDAAQGPEPRYSLPDPDSPYFDEAAAWALVKAPTRVTRGARRKPRAVGGARLASSPTSRRSSSRLGSRTTCVWSSSPAAISERPSETAEPSDPASAVPDREGHGVRDQRLHRHVDGITHQRDQAVRSRGHAVEDVVARTVAHVHDVAGLFADRFVHRCQITIQEQMEMSAVGRRVARRHHLEAVGHEMHRHLRALDGVPVGRLRDLDTGPKPRRSAAWRGSRPATAVPPLCWSHCRRRSRRDRRSGS